MVKNNGVTIHGSWCKAMLLHRFKSALFNVRKVSDCSHLHPLEMGHIPHRCYLVDFRKIAGFCSRRNCGSDGQ